MATALSRAARASSMSATAPLTSIFSQRWNSSVAGTATADKPSHHNDHHRNHVYLDPNNFVGSWRPARDPKEAEANLAMLRRQYAKQVKETRKRYIVEMELLKQEKLRKAEAKMEEIRLQREERKKSKAAAAEARAAERKAFEEEFRQTLLKERAEKLEYWKMRESRIEAKKNEKKEQLRRQSSLWVDEKDLVAKYTGKGTEQLGLTLKDSIKSANEVQFTATFKESSNSS